MISIDDVLWYVVFVDCKWYCDLVFSYILFGVFKDMNLQFLVIDYDLSKVVIY